MDVDKILIIIAFLVGIGFSFYILTHLRRVIEHINQWRAASIASLCISSFLFFTISHPKITKVVADVFGAKIQLNTLNNEIEEKQKVVSNLEKRIVSIQNEFTELQIKKAETKIALNSKSAIEALKEYQKKGTPIVPFSDNQIAVNPKLAVKAGKLKDLPEKFQVLSPDSWIVFDRGLPNRTEYVNSEVEAAKEAFSSKNTVFVIRATGEDKRVEKLTNSETEFLKNLIQNSSKSKK